MHDVLHQLRAAIDAAGSVDLDDLSAGELDELVVGLHRAQERLVGVTAAPLARWDADRVWAGDGCLRAWVRLARDARLSDTSARVALRRARKLADMPVAAEAVRSGRISTDHVDLLGRADQPHRHELFRRDEHLLVEQCATLRYAPLTRALDHWALRADAECDGPEPGERPSRLHASTTFEGTVRIDGTLDPVDGAIVTNELERLERQLRLADDRAGRERTRSERTAAALVEMATRSASQPGGARRPKPLFTVLLGERSFEWLCELGGGTVVAPGVVLPHLGTAELETLYFDGPTTVIGASPRRTFTGKLRRAVEVRDRHCQHPSGCDVPAERCDIDHIVPSRDGGETRQSNGRAQCTGHNRHADAHDHGAVPYPERTVDFTTYLRLKCRWHARAMDGDADAEQVR